MSVVASLLSIALFLAFMTSGAQRVVFNPFMSQTAERLGLTKAGLRNVGVAEMLGGVGLLVGLASKGNWLADLNEVGAALAALASLRVVVAQLRARDALRRYGPLLAMSALALIELVLRLTL